MVGFDKLHRVSLCVLPGTQALNHVACVQWVLMPHRRWIALNVRQPLSINSIKSSCSLCPSGYFQGLSSATLYPCREALLQDGRTKRSVLRVHSSIFRSGYQVCFKSFLESRFQECESISGFKWIWWTYETPCPLGRYAKNYSCKLCPTGYFQGSLNATACEEIGAGYHSKSAAAGATQKIECPPGTYSFTSSVECTSCPIGWFQPGYAGKECMQCPRGKSTLINGSRICIGIVSRKYLNNTFTVFSD